MKRTFAIVVLLAALGVLTKLAWKAPAPAPPTAGTVASPHTPGLDPDQPTPEAALRARYPEHAELVDRVLRDYHHNALAIERSDGLRGLTLLDRLGLEAVFLYEKYPREFRRLRDTLTDTAAADLLLHWREYFALKRPDAIDRGILIEEIARLTPTQRRVAADYPNALPLILAEPVGVTEMIRRLEDDPEALRDALVLLDFISLEPGAADLRAALRTLDEYGPLALDAFRLQAMEGFALVKLYGPVLLALGDALPLNDALILLRVNTTYIDELLASRTPETVASHLRHVAAVGLVEEVGGEPNALRLVVDFGPLGERALNAAGPDAATVVYGEFDDPTLRGQAVAALAEHGPMALAMLAKYGPDNEFREILRRYGPRVIPPVAQSDPAPEALAALRTKSDKSFTELLAQGVLAVSSDNGQATIRLIEQDGIERAEALSSTDVSFYEFLPLYDLLHLGRVLSRGHAPTTGEMAWALVDGCFIVADVLSLTALQPQGVAAAEAARTELKAAGREAIQAAGRALSEDAATIGTRALVREGAETTAERLSRWWAVRLAGGTYELLRRLPEALSRMSLSDITRLSRPISQKAGLRLSTWAPVRFVRDGATILQSIPPERGLKYVAAQALQASVGLVAIHKMEEHLASRRP